MVYMLLIVGCLGFFVIEDDNMNVTAKTLYVGGIGNYSTIKSAVNAAKAGDTVYVNNGTYNEFFNISKSINLIGYDSTTTIIDGQSFFNVITIYSNWVTISGFTIKNSGTGTSNAGILLWKVLNCTITNNNISSNNALGINLDSSSNIEITNNNISSNDMCGLWIHSSNNVEISNNNFEKNGYGPNSASQYYCGVRLESSSKNTLSGNQIIDNNFYGIRMKNANNNVLRYNEIRIHNFGLYWDSSGSGNSIYFNEFSGSSNNSAGGASAYITLNSANPVSYVYNNSNYTRYIGNYWDDYTGIDTDGDGIGNSYHNISTYQDLYPLVESIKNYTMIPTSIKLNMDASTFNSSNITVSVDVIDVTVDAVAFGDLNGSINITGGELVMINSSSFAGSGFFKANWNGIIEGKQYYGTWHGMLFNKSGERKIYLIGTILGGLQGITDGYLIESSKGSGNYDLYNSTWTISHVGSEIVFAQFEVNGTASYKKSTNFTSEIYILQSAFKGNATGYYNKTLNVVLTHIRINNKTSKYYGQGFSFITYTSIYGSGTGWTYDKTVAPNKVKLTGYFTKPIWGLVFGTLDESGSAPSISFSIVRLDIGLPPRPIIDIRVWTNRWASPGQTINVLLEIRNSGLKTANNTEIILSLPGKVTYIANSTTGVFNSSTGNITWYQNISAKSKILLSAKCKLKWGLSAWTKLIFIGVARDVTKNITLASDSFITTVRTAWDPNVKYGPEGNVTPNQKLNYTIEYENLGSGIAFGVYFTDELSINLNDSTLKIGPVFSVSNGSILAPPGEYDPFTRTITWFVGEVGPGEGGYANISINVNDYAPHGTKIINYGTVYFPSVPEVTPTNGVVSTVWINQKPIANAGNNKAALTLQVLTFDGSGSYDPDGLIKNYTWNFGDGNFGYGAVTTHAYSDDGDYTVRLTVEDDVGVSAYHEINVKISNREPIANLEIDSTEALTYEDIVFSAALSTDYDGTISSYYFDFGDGSNSGWISNPTVTHQYTDGTIVYSVSLKVRDDDNDECINVPTTEILINNRKPVPALYVEKTYVKTLDEVIFNASESYDLDGSSLEYFFDFGDGSNSSWVNEPRITHVYITGTQIYEMKLMVKDDDLETSMIEQEIKVQNRKPVADAGPDLNVAISQLVEFDSSGSSDPDGMIISYNWDFGDDTSSGTITTVKTTHVYNKPGEYTVTLTVSDGEFTGADTCVVSVHDIGFYGPLIESDFPTSIQIDMNFGEWSITLTDYETHEGPLYTGDDLKWYVTGNSGEIFDITGDNSTGTNADTFTFTSKMDKFGSEQLTYHLYDPVGLEVTIEQTVIINPTNIPPELEVLPDISIYENEEHTVNLLNYIFDSDTPFTSLQIETNYPDNAKIDGTTMIIEFADIGIYSVQISVDDGEYSVSDTFTVTVIDPDDIDGDGLPDSWEKLYNLDPTDPADALLDIDNDLLTNLQEYELNTDPTKIDTDYDGFIDSTDPYPLDPTLPAKSDVDVDDEPLLSNYQIGMIISIIIIILIIGILSGIIVKRRSNRIPKPFDSDERLQHIRDEIILGDETSKSVITDDELWNAIEDRYQNNEISEETYMLIEQEKLIWASSDNDSERSNDKDE
jgi:uncharacterized repeat protein (TIGR01451 family)